MEVQLPRASLDLTNATIDGGTAPIGTVMLQISQQSGHYSAASILLGTYTLELVDSQGHLIRSAHLLHPATLRYHYGSTELKSLGLDANHLVVSFPDQLVAQRAAKQSTQGLVVPFTNNAKTHTLTANIMTLGGTTTMSGESPLQLPPTPHLASVQGNSGQLSYSYPLTVPPGPGGFAPKLNLAYSSESTNERHTLRSPADSTGDGWDLSLGYITSENYPATSTSGAGTWYFLSGVSVGSGVSDRLVPGATSGDYETEHTSHIADRLYL